MNLPQELDDLITKAKAAGIEIGEIIAEMEGAIDGLKNEGDEP